MGQAGQASLMLMAYMVPSGIHGAIQNELDCRHHGSTVRDGRLPLRTTAPTAQRNTKRWQRKISPVTYSYNRQGQQTLVTDQRGCQHAYDFYKLGRQIHDRVVTPGSSVGT